MTPRLTQDAQPQTVTTPAGSPPEPPKDVVPTPPAPPPPPPEPPRDPMRLSRSPIDAALADPSKATKESLDAAYVWGSRRRAELQAALDSVTKGLEQVQAVSVSIGRTRRRVCFGQYDPTAALCTETCRDPLCPDATEKMRPGRLASLRNEATKVADLMGHPEYASKNPGGIPVQTGGMDVASVEPE